jgi:nitrogen fixation NifU-like protein
MLYNKKIMQHFLHPKNQGSIKNADGVGQAGNPVCGDIMKIYLKVKNVKGREVISNIKFETLGCATAIANSSALTEMVKGKTIEQALKITHQDIVKELGGNVPKIKIHCSFLAREAFKKAVDNYYQTRWSRVRLHRKNKKVRKQRSKKIEK